MRPPPQACAVHNSPLWHHTGHPGQRPEEQNQDDHCTAARGSHKNVGASSTAASRAGTVLLEAGRRPALRLCSLDVENAPSAAPTCDQSPWRQTVAHAAASLRLVDLIAEQNLARLRRRLRMGWQAAAAFKQGARWVLAAKQTNSGQPLNRPAHTAGVRMGSPGMGAGYRVITGTPAQGAKQPVSCGSAVH